MSNQEQYDQLAQCIQNDKSLSIAEQMEFYSLHRKVEKPSEYTLFHSLIELTFVANFKFKENVKYKLSSLEEEEIVHVFLEGKREKNGLIPKSISGRNINTLNRFFRKKVTQKTDLH